MKKNIHILLLIMLFAEKIESQNIYILGKMGYRELEWSDYKGTPDRQTSFKAYTHCNFKYTAEGIRIIGNELVHVDKLDVKMEFDEKNSWVKIDYASQELLLHERGHFYIAVMCLYELQEKLNNLKLTKKNFNNQLQNAFNEVTLKYRNMGILYDEETNHSLNAEAQETWNKRLNEGIQSLGLK